MDTAVLTKPISLPTDLPEWSAFVTEFEKVFAFVAPAAPAQPAIQPAFPVPPSTVESMMSTVLRQAADRLEQTGWVQGTARHADGRECAMQAIIEVAEVHRLQQASKVQYLITPAAHPMCGCPACRDSLGFRTAETLARFVNRGSVPEWNDQSGRTKAEVLTTMRALADRLDQQPKELPAAA